ncbi:AMP-binding protein [soil metagenome]
MNHADDDDRFNFPTLSEHGRRMLDFLREHPAAPVFRNRSGNRLLAAEVEQAHAFEASTASASVGWMPGDRPAWLADHLHRLAEQVPAYRHLQAAPVSRFEQLPTTSRADLAADITRFVPDDVAIDRLILFSTTGTTGQPITVPSHPVVAARYLAFHKRALRRFGIELRHGRGQVGVVLLGHQRRCFTYVSVTPTMNESGLVKLNLHPDDWCHVDDRTRYLDALDAEVLAGDPLSFAELLTLPLTTRPRALLSVGMMLTAGLRRELETRFACPVLDLYSMNEAGPIGVFDAAAAGHVLLQPDLFVEILDQAGTPVPEGEVGEITLTGGFNFCLPLLRYRTGDHAALIRSGHEPVLRDLQGRKPVRFRCADGRWINNIEVSHALSPLPLSQFGLDQRLDGSLLLRLTASAMIHETAARTALHDLFGSAKLSVQSIDGFDKTVQYTSQIDPHAQ